MANLSRLPRALRWVILGVSYLVLGLIALVALVMVAVNVPLVSNFIASKVTSALEPSFKGRVVLHRLGHIDFGGVIGAEAEVLDPAGNSVLGARNVDVRLFWPGLVWQLLTGSSEETTIGIDRIAVEHLRVGLVDDGSGSPTLAQAFEPREPNTEPEEEPASTSIVLREIQVDNAEVRGSLASPGPIDADLANLLASLESRPESLHLTLARADVTARQVPQIDRLSGRVTAEVTLPATTTAGTSRGQPPVVEGNLTTTASLALRPADAPSRRITAAFAGEIAGSGASAQLRMVGEELRAELEAPALRPSTLTQLAPGLSPQAPTGLVAKVEGALDDFGFDARVSQEATLVTATGRIRQHEGSSSIQAHIEAARVNVARLIAGAVDTDFSLAADTNLTFDESGGKGNYRVVTRKSRVATEQLPPARFAGDLSLPSEKPVVTTGTLNIDEPGAATEIRYQVEARDAGVRAEVSSRTELRHSARLATLSGGLSATGELTTKVNFDAADERLDASFDLDLSGVKHPEAAARRVRVSGRAEGNMLLPKLDITARLSGVSAAGRRFSAVRATAQGTPSRLQITATADGTSPNRILVAGTFLNGSELAVRDADVRVTDERGNLHLRARHVAFPPGKIRVDGMTLDGPGHAELSLRYGPGLEHLVLKTDRLNAARLLAIVGIESPLHDGQLTVDAELSGRTALPNGRLDIALTDLTVGQLKGARAHAKLLIDRGKVSGTAEVELARGAKTSISVKDMKIPFGSGSAEVRSMTGDVSIDGELDLKQLEGLLSSYTGLERAEGKVRLNVALERPQGDATPTWRAHVRTKGLVLVQKRPDVDQNQTAEQAEHTSPLWVRGIDLEVDAALEKDNASVQGKLFDRQGDLVRIAVEWKGLGGLGNPARLREKFQAAPFTARVEVPPRAFEKFPAPIRPTEITGIFSLGVEAEGTLLHPSVRTRGRIERFGAANERPGAPRLDLELRADYAQGGGSVQLNAHDRQHPLLELASSWKGDAALLASQLDGKSPVVGNVELTLDEFPVEIVPALHNRQIRGKVSGKMRLDELGKDAQLLFDVTTRNLRVDRLRVDRVKTLVQTKGGRLVVRASIAGQAGAADAELETGIDWGNRIVPTLDDQLKGSLRTQKFRLSALQPLVEGSVSELDGKLDADIRAVMDGASPRLSGQLQLKEGILHLPSVGQRFHDMSASVKVSPQAIVLEKLRARGTSGGFEADAEAKLDGLTPTAATLNLRIKEGDKLPLTVEGEAIGDGWGNIVVRYDHDEAGKKNTLVVRLDEFNVELPQSPPRGIQDLNQPDHVRVGFYRKDREFVAIPLQPLKEPGAPSEYETVVVVELGSVRVEKGQQAEVALGGEVRATLGKELDVQGKVETRRGSLDISGKKFEIERGTVTFTGGKPDDPTISAVARYDSPDGYTVYAEYTGTVKEGKLRLSSEPPLSQDEILTLLMFGTPDGSVGAGSGGNSLATAVSVAGGTAAQGLNRALSDVTDLDVSARIDTSTGAPRPELVLQLTSRVAARVTQALGEPGPGQSPDRTFLTIELRLANSWSLSTMIGDRGATALDLIWRRRY